MGSNRATRAVLIGGLFFFFSLGGPAGPAQAADKATPKGTRAADEAAIKSAQDAVKRAIPWLRKELEAILASEDAKGGRPKTFCGTREGYTYLCALALLHGGVPKSDPIFKRVWGKVEQDPANKTYETGLALMWCEGMLNQAGPGGPPAGSIKAWVQKAADKLAEFGAGGVWSYTLERYGKGNEKGEGKYAVEKGQGQETPPIGSAEMEALLEKKTAYGDLSNIQYAVLGLKGAALCGVRPAEANRIWRFAAQRQINHQQQQGPAVRMRLEDDEESPGVYGSVNAKARGWGYYGLVESGAATGSMTSAGMGVLAIARSEIRGLSKEEDRLLQEAIRDGAAWMAEHFSIEENPSDQETKAPNKLNRAFSYPRPWHFYYLYGLERAGVLTDLARFGKHAWYAQGVKYLVAQQGPDGSWLVGGRAFGEDATLQTCFAILFLSKATSRRYAQPYKAQDIGEEERPAPPQQKEPQEAPEPAVRPLDPPSAD